MHLKVNGKDYHTQFARTLSELIGEMEGFNKDNVAIAVDEKIVPKQKWEEFKLQEGSEIELVRPVQGG